jgi:cytochrome c biogenesis protein CcdA
VSELVLLGSALWLGILTSISPCPLATNLAAVSFIGKRAGNPRLVLFSGLAYTLGRVTFYTGLALLLVYGLLSAPMVSLYLQKYMIMALGPVLLLTGMFPGRGRARAGPRGSPVAWGPGLGPPSGWGSSSRPPSARSRGRSSSAR